MYLGNKIFGGLEIIDISQSSSWDPRVKLVKLHGSVNWYKIKGGEIAKSERDRIKFGGRIVKGNMMLPYTAKGPIFRTMVHFIQRVQNGFNGNKDLDYYWLFLP